MKIRMKTLAVGKWSAVPGQEIEVNPELGNELVAGSYAELIESERADGPKPENKASGTGGRSRRSKETPEDLSQRK